MTTPREEAPLHCEGCIASKDGRDWQCLGIALGAEAETPDHAFEPMRDANDLTCSRCLRRHPSWVDLASPETADALARALHKAGIRCNPNIIYCGASHKGHAGRLLAAMRETGR